MKGWEYNGEQDNAPVFINKCLWNSFFLRKSNNNSWVRIKIKYNKNTPKKYNK